jgi:alpha-L-fucosidase
MHFSRRRFLKASAALGLAPLASTGVAAMGRASKPFTGTWDSLISQYRAPEWFRDAKFGIWAHWGPQCVPEQGDWYARNMYVQGSSQYQFHVERYGHPSRFGFMEINRLWKAEHWDPQALMKRYVAAGAKYFVAMANHHDNFDAYASRHHAWNSVSIGPKQDIVGTWEKVARAAGLRFGVSNHSGHAWHWFQTAYGYDGEGPLAGVRYDAATLKKADGQGKWWEGLDPQELYTGPNIRMPDGIHGIAEVRAWQDVHTGEWLESAPPNHPELVRKWSLRCRDLIDQYRPDLVYFDNSGLPFEQAGLDMTAYYYNASRGWHGGHLEAVVNAKKLPTARRAALVEDIERGVSEEARPLPWQTCTCLGNWHYDRALFERHGYKSALTVIQMLCDVVAKNGNLLLSVPMRGDGTIDEDERNVLDELAAWMKVNGEAIFGTRPCKVFGEGPPRAGAGMFSEGKTAPYTAEDVRFTTRGGTLYAMTLDAPRGTTVTFKSWATGQTPDKLSGNIERVELLGFEQPLRFEHTAQGLTITLPSQRAAGGVTTFRIQGFTPAAISASAQI